jgi:hypothetical protein
MISFEDCIKDVDRALNCGYPKKQQLYTLYLRKAKCLKYLNRDYLDCLDDSFKVRRKLKIIKLVATIKINHFAQLKYFREYFCLNMCF